MATARATGLVVRKFSTSAPRNSEFVKLPLKLYGLEGKYATALYKVASRKQQLGAVEKELAAFQVLLKKDTVLRNFLNDPLRKVPEKQAAIAFVAKKQNYSTITANFFGAMSENNRMSKVNGILNAFDKIMAAQKGLVDCTVTVAQPLDAASMNELNKALKMFEVDGQSLVITTKTDPRIQGGMTVQIGDSYIDMSTKTKIKKYEALLRDIQ